MVWFQKTPPGSPWELGGENELYELPRFLLTVEPPAGRSLNVRAHGQSMWDRLFQVEG